MWHFMHRAWESPEFYTQTTTSQISSAQFQILWLRLLFKAPGRKVLPTLPSPAGPAQRWFLASTRHFQALRRVHPPMGTWGWSSSSWRCSSHELETSKVMISHKSGLQIMLPRQSNINTRVSCPVGCQWTQISSSSPCDRRCCRPDRTYCLHRSWKTPSNPM